MKSLCRQLMVCSGKVDVLIPGSQQRLDFSCRSWAVIELSDVNKTSRHRSPALVLDEKTISQFSSVLLTFQGPLAPREWSRFLHPAVNSEHSDFPAPLRMQHWDWVNLFLFSVFEVLKLVGNAKKALWSFSLKLFWQSSQTWRGVSLTSLCWLWKWAVFRAWALRKCQEANTDKTL